MCAGNGNRMRWLLAIVAMLLSASCSSGPTYQAGAAECDSNSRCHLTGRLEVFTGSYGSGAITTSKSCYDVALPKAILQDSGKWDGKSVTIVGEAISRPEMRNLMWYAVKDRRVDAGGCGTKAIYVEQIWVHRHH